jgi:hypothetical protein
MECRAASISSSDCRSYSSKKDCLTVERHLPAVPLVFCLLLAASAPPMVKAEEAVDYLRDVKPLLAERCYPCHGVLKQSGGLRLDTALSARQGGDSGEAILPGQPEHSLLLDVVTGEAGYRMPPEGEGAELTETQIHLLRKWIAEGAGGPEDETPQEDPQAYWSYRDLERPSVPHVAQTDWVRNPIDSFLAAEHEQRNLVPSPEADRAVLLRRLYLDLIGIPPTPEQLDNFLADTQPHAYERVVDHLLNSPLHGQRWGRHWMDVWRYSDWYGSRGINQIRYGQRHAWRWRDWIVDSLNEDKGYDQMVREMLAGDELQPGNADVVRATGFLGRNWYKFDRDVWMFDTVEHTAQAFLGLTLRCCRCHDHKFDPISQEEYFRFRAFFEPHDVRTDPLGIHPPTETDTGETVLAEGVALVYDKELDVPTYLFQRGDSRYPDESNPLSPDIPEALGGTLPPITPVPLPISGHSPMLRDEFVAARRAELKAAVAATAGLREQPESQPKSRPESGELAESDVLGKPSGGEQTGEELAGGETTGEEQADKDLSASEETPESLRRQVAMWQHRVAKSELAWFEAVVAAEQSRITAASASASAIASASESVNADMDGGASGDGGAASGDDSQVGEPEEAAQAAGAAERIWKRDQAELAVVQARLAERTAELSEHADDAEREKALQQAVQQREAAEKQRADAQQQVDSPTTPAQYTPLGPSYPQTSTGRRTALAEWMVSPANRRTARVAVNHIWLRHFGEALVPSVANFGMNGQKPSHSELLDWLAMELVENNWSLKHIHRLLVTSTAYRMVSSEVMAEKNHAIDPENRWLWRMNSRRLESEGIRDSVLQVARKLDVTPGGAEIPEGEGATNFRRSLYFRSTPNETMTFLDLFDQANPNECYRRQESVVPQQALALSNSPLVLNASRELAERLRDECRAGDHSGEEEATFQTEFITAAFRQILGRPPTAEEQQACRRFLERQQEQLATDLGTPYSEVSSPIRPAASDPAQRALENLIHVLMNHNDFVTIR